MGGMQRYFFVLVLALALNLPSLGQTFGDITGVVTDGSGAVVVGATITITNPATNFTRQTVTNAAGNYNFPVLQPGAYNVRAENPGFQGEIRSGIQLQVQQTARIDFQLQVGVVAQAVEVSGAAALINTENATIGTVIENRRIVELPLNGRNFLALVGLSPNVSAGFNSFSSTSGGGAQGRQGGDRANLNISVAGQRREFNNYTIDGVTNIDVSYNLYLFLPSVDAIQEFKVQTGIYSAEFGRGVGQINVLTKGGTNQYHGALFEFLRNNAIDARPYAFTKNIPAKAPLRWNQFGFTLGGPVQIPKVFNGKDRLFFMSNYEGFRVRQQAQALFNTPPLAMRDGDFRQLGTVLLDPLNRTPSGAKLPFAVNNVIPSRQFHPVAVKLLEFYPKPNVPGAGLSNNYLALNNNITDKDQFSQRIDFVENSSSTWFGRYSWSKDFQATPNFYLNGFLLDSEVRQGMISNIRILSPTLVNEARFGVNGFHNDNINEMSYKRDVMSELGINVGKFGPFDYGIPLVAVTGYSGIGPSPENPYRFRNYNFDWVDNISWTRGKHSIKIGADIRRDRFNTHGNFATRGSWSVQTQATGYGFADFLTGYLQNTFKSVAQVSTQLRATTQAYFISDNWKVRPNFTIDVGLRYEYTQPWGSKNDNYSNVDIPHIAYTRAETVGKPHPTLIRKGIGDPYANSLVRFNPEVQVARDGRLGDRLINSDYKNFAPRVGIAWSPTSKWTIRSGFGIFYVQDIGNAYFDISRNFSGRIQALANTTTNDLTFSDPSFLNRSNACGTSPPLVCISTPGLLSAQVDRRTPYVLQYELNIQRQIDQSTVVEVGYFGSGSHFLQRFHNLNNPVPGTGAVALRIPWPELNPIQHPEGDVDANYQSLAGKLTRRLSKGLTYLVSYTYSKSLDDGSGIRSFAQDSGIQNSACVRCERARASFDQRQRLVTSILYELPAGKGHRLFNSGIGNQLLGGWQVSSIITSASGSPLGVGDGTDRSGTNLASRPNATGQSVNLDSSLRSSRQWFNLAAFTRAPVGTFGNVGRNVATGPPVLSWDFSAMKRFEINESSYLQFRFEAFNAANHPNLADPAGLSMSANQINATTGVAVPGTGAFGVISSTRTDMRQLQIALKLVF